MVHRPARAGRVAGASGLALVVSMALGASGALAQPPDGADWHAPIDVTDHGVAATEVNVRNGAVGTLPDGRDVVHMHSNGNPVSYNVVDMATGDVLSRHALDPKSIGAEIHVLDDGSTYFNVRDGSGADLYHWDSTSFELTRIERNPVGERLIRTLETDEDGILYGVTYPNAKLFAYDPDTDEFRDYGSTATVDSYAEGLAVQDGVAYVGTGMEVGTAVAVDLESGDMTPLEVPDGYERITRFVKFRSVGDLVAMSFSPGLPGGTNVLFWDTTQQDWVCDGAIPRTVSLNVPFATETRDGRMFYKSQGEIWSFDSNDCSVEATGWVDTDLGATGSHRILDLLSTGTEEAPEYRLVGTNNDGSFWTFDPDTGESTFVESQIFGAPLTAHSIHVAADERVYVGTYLGPGALGRFNPQTQEFEEQLNGPLQASSFLTFGDQIIVGSYGNAVVHMGDPSQEWDWGTNPSQQFRLIDGYQQDRLLGQATDGELVAMATVSDYGVRGGALTLTDMADYRETFRDLVEDQSHVSVTFGQDGLIYSGTSIRGGLSSQDSELDAHLVVFDPETTEVVDAVVPVEGNDVVAGVTSLGTSIWGVTNSSDLFEYDTEAGEVVGVHDLGTAPASSPWGVASTVQAHPHNGLLYGIAGTDVFAFDPETGQSQILLDDTGYKRMDIAADGTIYVIDETNFFSITVGDDGEGEPGSAVEQIRALQSDVADYIEAGDIAGPIAHQVTNALDQAEKHLEGDRTTPAIQALNRVIRHVENPKRPDTLSEQAQADVLEQARAILAELE